MRITNKFLLLTIPLILLYNNITVAAENDYALLPRGPDTYRVYNGIYWTNSLSYTHHPSVAPKEEDAYNLLTQITVSL
ncbi:hypothetical protein [Photorhabdus sp. CRCIA-P01]|uniref:hypothetical protein n=1 Tax=Photorhabdus sp. CRCIA-P01 TaxID=2019570 RepID=UPI000E59F8B5